MGDNSIDKGGRPKCELHAQFQELIQNKIEAETVKTENRVIESVKRCILAGDIDTKEELEKEIIELKAELEGIKKDVKSENEKIQEINMRLAKWGVIFAGIMLVIQLIGAALISTVVSSAVKNTIEHTHQLSPLESKK